MKYSRIIPRLDIKGPNLVKGINLEGLRVLGKPEEFALEYYNQGADELIYHDAVASLYERDNLLDIVNKTANNIFIPMTVGGGIRNLNNIKYVLRAGADKVSINTAAVKNPDFINKAAEMFGSSTIVISIETYKQSDGKYLVYTENGREIINKNVMDWTSEAVSRGAGEILITSIDKEGTGLGMDLKLIKKIVNSGNIPIIAHGGIGKLEHIEDCLILGKADAVCLASMLHYGAINIKKTYENEKEGNFEFLKNIESNQEFGFETISTIKNFLNKKRILVSNYGNSKK